MSPRGTRLVAVGIVCLLLGGVGAAVVFALREGISGEELANQLPVIAAVLAFGLLGALIVARQPGNAMGWLFAAVGLLGAAAATELAVEHVLSRADGTPPAWAVVAAWYQEWFWLPLITLILLFVPLLFPDGRLPSPRWRPLLWVAVVSVSASTAPLMFRERLTGSGYDLANPIGITGAEQVGTTVFAFAEYGLLATALGVAAAVIVRLRRSRGVERQQLKAFAAVTVTSASLLIVLEGIGLEAPFVVEIVAALVVVAIPVSAGLAVLRYRLYEIDRIISRTLAYAVVVALLGAVYVLSVLVLQRGLRPVTAGSDLAVAASTLAVAAAFGPVRRRVQSLVDRRFNRSRYDAAREVERFGARMRDDVDLDALASDLERTVLGVVQPSYAALWLSAPRSTP